MDSWWELGEYRGYHGRELAVHAITCPFCMEDGNFQTAAHFAKENRRSGKTLNFDTLRCGNCAGYVMVLWSASERSPDALHDYHVLPWPTRITKHPKYWPTEVGQSWIEAHRSLADENWNAAAVMARSSVQAALRDQGATGGSLFEEINNLASKGTLPPLMKEWSHEVRVLARPAAHPRAGAAATDPKDARDVVSFLDYLLEYLYDLPERIRLYRGRRNVDSPEGKH